ncbi:MAG TPA: hypothetical protein DCP71_07270, partial [Verrucomicrobiales bacterium]|nr:hypothetical protein [Verrucomicrobiales bacterium]
LRLDELAQMQDEVAMLLGFGGPAAEAAKVAGMKFTAEGKLEKADAPEAKAEAAAEDENSAPEEIAEAPDAESAEAEEDREEETQDEAKA